jgi:hypothetical protein
MAQLATRFWHEKAPPAGCSLREGRKAGDADPMADLQHHGSGGSLTHGATGGGSVWRAEGDTRKARRFSHTGPVTIVVRTSALQGAVGPTIRTSASKEGSYTAQSDPAAGRVRKKEKGPGVLGTRRGQFMEEPNQSWPGEDQDSEI